MASLATLVSRTDAHSVAPEPRGLLNLLPACFRWHQVAAPARVQRGVSTAAAARRVSAATLLAERVAEQDMAEADQLSAVETERRRRSLEASYDAEAHTDLFEAGRSEDQASASDRLEASWRTTSSDPASGSSSAAAVDRANKQRTKRKGSMQPSAALATSHDAADASDQQVLNRSMSGSSRASLRAARRHTDQGRVKASYTNGSAEMPWLHSQKLGPAETFLQALDQRLIRARGSSRRSVGPNSAGDAVSWYLSSMGGAPVLTRNEEMQLGAIIHLGNTVIKAAEELAKQNGEEQPSLEVVTQHLGLRSVATVRQRLRNAEAARDMMVQHNVRLVMTVVRQYTDRGVDTADLLPAGLKGLERAIDRFDASKGFKFSTYAHWWIRQAVSRCVQEHSRVVRLPVNVYEMLSKINKTARRLNAQEGRRRPATYNEIALALKVPVTKVIQVVRAAREIKSLDTPTDKGNYSGDDKTELLVDTLADNDGAEQEVAENMAVREQVNQALKGLDLRPRNILRYRYGLHQMTKGEPLTLNQVGELYGLKGERVRQIEGVAMSMLKGALKAQQSQRRS